MDYKIIYSSQDYPTTALSKLAENVNIHIKNGWKPIGGVSITYGKPSQFDACQAMIKE